MEKCKLFNLNVSTGNYYDFVQTIIGNATLNLSEYACVANVHMLIEAYKSKYFANRVNNATLITPDGMPLTWAMRLLYGIKQERVAGMDLLPQLLQHAEKEELPVYFYGGSEKMLEQTKAYLQSAYPSLQVSGMYSPPFRPLTFREEAKVVERINNSGAKLVFVVLGCPKQEKWMASMKGRINAFMIGVGGALPVMIGMQKRAPKWMQTAGLEWLYRFGQEPKRLFKRYAVTNALFLYLFMRAFLQQKVFRLTA